MRPFRGDGGAKRAHDALARTAVFRSVRGALIGRKRPAPLRGNGPSEPPPGHRGYRATPRALGIALRHHQAISASVQREIWNTQVMVDQEPVGVSFRPLWEYDVRATPVPVNQMLLQAGFPTQDGQPSGEVFVTLGHINPPAVIPNGEGGVEVFGVEDGRVPVSVVGHFSMTRAKLEEFHGVLSQWLNSTDSSIEVVPDESGR